MCLIHLTDCISRVSHNDCNSETDGKVFCGCQVGTRTLELWLTCWQLGGKWWTDQYTAMRTWAQWTLRIFQSHLGDLRSCSCPYSAGGCSSIQRRMKVVIASILGHLVFHFFHNLQKPCSIDITWLQTHSFCPFVPSIENDKSVIVIVILRSGSQLASRWFP